MKSHATYWLSVLLVMCVLVMCVLASEVDAQNKREQQVRRDKAQLAADDSWYYDDLDAGIEQANKTGMPIMVVLRCIP